MKQFMRKLTASFVHIFTATGAVFGLLAIHCIYQHKIISAFWLMGIAILIDALDGTLARWFKVKEAFPQIDGVLLDNIVDYLNYVVVPACLLLNSNLIPTNWKLISAVAVLLTSAYQFCQIDAKTPDHFFKGFPSYWNIVVIYLFFWKMTPVYNLMLILILSVFIFIPLKYIYPSRMEYLTKNRFLRGAMLFATVLWGLSMFGQLWLFPVTNTFLVTVSTAYLSLYFIVSIYRTFYQESNHLMKMN